MPPADPIMTVDPAAAADLVSSQAMVAAEVLRYMKDADCSDTEDAALLAAAKKVLNRFLRLKFVIPSNDGHEEVAGE